MEKPAPSWRGTFGHMHPPEAKGTALALLWPVLEAAIAAWARLPKGLRMSLARIGVVLFTIAIFAGAIAFGIFVAISYGDGHPGVAVATTLGVLLFVVLPLRLWWVLWRSRSTPDADDR